MSYTMVNSVVEFKGNWTMPNADNTYGTFNKLTKILSQVDDGSTVLTNFADVEEAKNFFFHSDALTVFDECCTELQWVVVDNQKLKYTMTFGIKEDRNIEEGNDWAEEYRTRLNAFSDAGTLANNPYTEEESTDHLF